MIPVNDPALYAAALGQLSAYKRSFGRTYKGRFVQIFLGLKFYQNQLPSMHSGQFVPTAVLQTLLDDLYCKASLPIEACILTLFEGTYLPRTGVRRAGHGPENTWRNNFNLQKGIGCYAPATELESRVFLDQSRASCRHLIRGHAAPLAEGRCALCPGRGTYRREDHRKWLRIDPGENGYAVLDLLDTVNYIPYVAPGGHRIPVVPLIAAMYHDSSPGLVTGVRTSVDVTEFAADFNFSPQEMAAYFDDDRANIYNAALIALYPQIRLVPMQPLAQPAPTPHPQAGPGRPVPQPILVGTQAAPPPGVNTGWEAEQLVASILQQDGWQVYDVSRQKVGYDLIAKKGRRTRYVDAKSSLGLCAPTLTAREWQQAQAHGTDYVLSVVEHFNPVGMNTVYWVPNPAGSCQATASTTTCYSLARSSWITSAVPLHQI